MKVELNYIFRNQRVGVFIDGMNLYYAVKEYGEKVKKVCYVNYSYFLKEVGERQLILAKAYFVKSFTDTENKQQSFFNTLEDMGYIIRAKDTQVRPDLTMKGNLDIEIVLDIVSMAEKLDVVILVSGDGDFTPLVTFLKTKGIIVEVWCYEGSLSEELRREADVVKVLPFNEQTIFVK